MNYDDHQEPSFAQTEPDETRRFCISFIVILLVLSSPTIVFGAAPPCSDTDTALEYWRPIKVDLPDSVTDADVLALDLVACLGSKNSELRDGIAYESLTYWLRNDALSRNSKLSLLTNLTSNLIDARMETSLVRSFSALILAELLRADAQESFMSDVQRDHLLAVTVKGLEKEREFRGLVDDIGWIHPIAHLSDILWRFALHPQTNSDQIDQILESVATKVAPPKASYHFNESDRLARVISTVIRQSNISDEKMANWLTQFETPKSMEKWSHAFQTPAGMAELHNTKQFLRALSDQLTTAEVGEATNKYLTSLVQGFTQLI